MEAVAGQTAAADVRRLREALLAYYRARARMLPWRETLDPYAIWISEVMLQQTQVQTVIPRFAAFLARFPDVVALASARESTVCEAWAGLGYYRRARNLHKAAGVVVAQWQGKLPDSEAGLRTLPGVGAYTAAAIASIAYRERTAAVDGNLVRVLSRVFALPGSVSDPRLVRAVRERARPLVDCDRPGDVNQALMDLGATLCRPELPRCEDCPLVDQCSANRTRSQARYPGPKTKAPKQDLPIAFAWIERQGKILLEQRPLDGLWPGLWELPSASGPRAKAELSKRLGAPLGKRMATVTHELTHRRVSATVYASDAAIARGRWWREPLSAPLSSLARKAVTGAMRRTS